MTKKINNKQKTINDKKKNNYQKTNNDQNDKI